MNMQKEERLSILISYKLDFDTKDTKASAPKTHHNHKYGQSTITGVPHFQ